jgi:hypothetical protein
LPAGKWTHLAGVYDGQEIALYVNGEKSFATNATGARLSSDKSLYIGARPNGAFNTHNFSYPLIYWRGAVDDVRVSRGARYTGHFTPHPRLTRDTSTIFALANDQHFGPFVPLDAESSAKAEIRGSITFAPVDR